MSVPSGEPSASWWSRRKTWQKVVIIGGGVFLLLVVLTAIFGDTEEDDPEAADTTTTTTLEDTSTTEPEEETTTSTTEATTTTTEATTTTTTPTTTTTTFPPVLAEGEGSGDDVIDLDVPDVAAIVTFTHSGSGNFAVWTLDEGFEETDLLVNTIGSYNGTRPLQFEGPVAGFEITANGSWTYVVAPLEEADRYNCPFEGTGDDVILVEDFMDSGGPTDLAYDSNDNFAIWGWGATDLDLIVNEIGPYEGTVLVGSGLFVWDIMGTSGTWSVGC